MESYLQEKKCEARHVALKSAIRTLTTERMQCCCVENSYVRNLYDYFTKEYDGEIQKEIQSIDVEYIKEWEKFHRTYIGEKRVEELTVCYLCGPEPENDFKELLSMGILPHNIWAFENNDKIYNKALVQLCNGMFPRPKLIESNIEKYFKDIPKKFDIFYYDACATAVSRNALRPIATLCKYHRLNSPGVIITNFSEPDFSHGEEFNRVSSIIEPYFSCKEDNKLLCCGDTYIFERPVKIKKDEIHKYYSEFITQILLDIASSIVPIQRFFNSDYARDILNLEIGQNDTYSIAEFNQIHNDTYKFVYLRNLLKEKNAETEIFTNLFSSLSGYEGYRKNICCCYKLRQNMIKGNEIVNERLKDAISFFNQENSVFQFLDKPDSSLYVDLLINQMGYPLHFVTDKIKRFEYQAKTNIMMLDIIPYDECRYIYEWLPATDQILKAYEDKSWQYVFRFAVDGLVKNRISVNNDIFYKGSVISRKIDGFKTKEICERRKI